MIYDNYQRRVSAAISSLRNDGSRASQTLSPDTFNCRHSVLPLVK